MSDATTTNPQLEVLYRYTLIYTVHLSLGTPRLVYGAAVVHLASINQLLSAPDSDLLRIRLVQKRLVSRLDGVHRVLRTRHARCEIVNASSAAHLEDTMWHAETKAYGYILSANFIQTKFRG